MVLIPAGGRFLVLPLLLQGPCHGVIRIQLDGELLAPAGKQFATGDYWLSINQVNNLFIDGSGRLNGSGSTAWSFNVANRPVVSSSFCFSLLTINLTLHLVYVWAST